MFRKTVLLGTAGVVLAGAAIYWVQLNPGVQEQLGLPVPAVEAHPELLSTQEATVQRASHYQDVDSVAETLELPSNFARREALHVIAGRADAGQLRSLISEAKRVSDAAIRADSLEILLLRYVEVDPPAALKSAQETDRSAAPRLVSVVIGAWSRTQLDAAMAAARALPDEALRTAAARAIVSGNPRIALQAKAADGRRQLAARLGIRETSDALVLDTDPAKVLDDPHGAIEEALAMPDAARRAQLVRIAQAWARVAPTEAWEHAANLPEGAARIVFENAVIATWAATQPDLAFAHVSSLGNHGRRDQLLKQVTVELARRDPVLAMQVVKGLRGSDRASLQSIVVDEWARYDPASAATWVEGLDRMQQSRYAFIIGESYVLQDRDEALAWALRISRSPGRNLWSRMLAVLAGQDPTEALRLAAAAESPAQRNQAISSVLSAIAVRDPALAASHLDKLPASTRTRVTMQIAAQMAETNSMGAVLDWLEGVDASGRAFADAVPMLGQMFAQRDPDAAAQLLERIPKSARGAWITSIAGAYADIDVEKGLQWVRKFENDPDAEGLERNFVSILAQRNPDAALEMVERIPDAQERDQRIMSVLPMIAMQSPETAVRYYNRIADQGMRDHAIQMVVSQWVRNDPAGAQKWVMSMPSSAARDNGISALIHGDMDANSVASLIGQMQSPDRRSDAVMSAAMRLQRTNPDEARALLRRYPLDPARQQQLEMMQQHRSQNRGAVYWRGE
jgi:hypothetical protein